MAVYREVWTGEVEKGLSRADEAGFLDGIKNLSQYVEGSDESQTIHSTYFDVLPEVLIGNTTYPIGVQDLNGGDFAVSLDKFQTKATPITDDELHALAYDKIQLVKDSHVQAIAERKQDKAVHALAPNTDTLTTPVLLTTGPIEGNRRRLIREDLVRFKDACDKAKMPTKGRRLILCNEHVNDLLLLDQKFTDQYYNFKTGAISSIYNFEIFEYAENPLFDVTNLTKKSFGSIPGVDDREATVAFCVSKAVKAMGLTKMYFSEAKNDTQTQRNLINFRHYFIVLPSALKAIGAMVSAGA